MERLLISQLLKWKDSSKTINIPFYMLFVLDKELKAES